MIWGLFGVFLVFLYLRLFYLENFKNHKREAPGPLRIPPFGNLIQIGLADKITHVGLHKLAKKYGDVMSIKMGLIDTVILSSYVAVKQVFNKDEAAGRDCSGVLYDRNLKQDKIGLIFSQGPSNDDTQNFCRETLKTYGYGNRESMKNVLLDELTELLKFIENESESNPENRVHFCSDYFNGSFLNIMATWVMGKRYNYSDPDFQLMLQNERELAKNGAMGAGLMMAYPFLRHIFPETLGYNTQMNGVRGFKNTALKFLSERKKQNYSLNPTCFTDNFLQKMGEDANKAEPLYTEDHFAVLFGDIIQAGTDTTSNVVNFTMLQLLVNPTVQEKVYQEILNVIGIYRFPDIEDKYLMPYTQAVLLEGLRWARVLVLGSPRKAMKDFVYRNYLIKKGTILMFNSHSIFFDEDFWGDPYVFRPERFLDVDGNVDAMKNERVQIAFGTGKRVCFGEVLARDSLFIFITTLLQKFKFTLPPGSKPSLEPIIGISLYPEPYDAIVTLRNK